MRHTYDFKPHAERLLKALSNYKIIPLLKDGAEKQPSINDIASELKAYFSFEDIKFTDRIRSPEAANIDWWKIDVNEFYSPVAFEHVNHVTVTSNFADAIGLILDENEAGGVYPGIESSGDSFWFRDDGTLMFKLSRMEFEKVDPSLCKKVKLALKGINHAGDEAQMIARLNKIPNFESLFHIKEQDPGFSFIRSVSMLDNFPKSMQEMFRGSFDLDIKLSLAMEIAAQTFGAATWNIFKAKHDEHQDKVYTPFRLDCRFAGTFGISTKYYRNNIEAITGLIELGNKSFEQVGEACEIYRLSDDKLNHENALSIRLVMSDIRRNIKVRPRKLDVIMSKAFIKSPEVDANIIGGSRRANHREHTLERVKALLNGVKPLESLVKFSDSSFNTKSVIAGETLITLSGDENNVTLKSLNGSTSGVIDYSAMRDIKKREKLNGENSKLKKDLRYINYTEASIDDAELVVDSISCTLEHSGLYTSITRTVWQFGKLSDETILKIGELTGVRISWTDKSKKEKYKSYIPKVYRV